MLDAFILILMILMGDSELLKGYFHVGIYLKELKIMFTKNLHTHLLIVV